MSDKKVVIITGANSGIGLEASRYFCKDGGFEVILACRSEANGQATRDALKEQFPSCDVQFIRLELSSQASVRQFVADFNKTAKPLHILVNNAGISGPKVRTVNDKGLEMALATNHIGHFLLTDLLLEKLKHSASETGEARIVVVASTVHDTNVANKIPGQTVQEMDMEDLQLQKAGAYSPIQAYKNSKLANILFSMELSRRLDSSNVTVNAMCPGFIPRTNLQRATPGCVLCFMRTCLDGLCKCCKITRGVDDGGLDIFRLATDAKYKGVTAKFISSGREKAPSSEAQDVDKQKALWEFSEKAVLV